MIEPSSSASQLPFYPDRRAATDGQSASQRNSLSGSQGDDDTPIRQPQQASEDSRLDTEEQAQLRELKRRDQQVRAHEQAHISVGGRYITSRAQFSYQQGPDGNRYATGGEVGIDVSPVPGDPQATIRKMQTVARAALAPADPSVQDRNVASAARQAITQARIEVARQQAEARLEDDSPGNTTQMGSPSRLGYPSAGTSMLESEPEINLDEVV
jgi:hypothetical protein